MTGLYSLNEESKTCCYLFFFVETDLFSRPRSLFTGQTDRPTDDFLLSLDTKVLGCSWTSSSSTLRTEGKVFGVRRSLSSLMPQEKIGVKVQQTTNTNDSSHQEEVPFLCRIQRRCTVTEMKTPWKIKMCSNIIHVRVFLFFFTQFLFFHRWWTQDVFCRHIIKNKKNWKT